MLNELKLRPRYAFFRESNDDVIFVDSAGRKIPMKRKEATARILKKTYSREDMIPVLIDSIILTDKEVAYVNAKIIKMRSINGMQVCLKIQK